MSEIVSAQAIYDKHLVARERLEAPMRKEVHDAVSKFTYDWLNEDFPSFEKIFEDSDEFLKALKLHCIGIYMQTATKMLQDKGFYVDIVGRSVIIRLTPR